MAGLCLYGSCVGPDHRKPISSLLKVKVFFQSLARLLHLPLTCTVLVKQTGQINNKYLNLKA